LIVDGVLHPSLPHAAVPVRVSLQDLAGSERQSKTDTQGHALCEGQHINRSLLVLSTVVSALAEGKAKSHVPYRDSKLTRLLQDSLGGSAKTCIIVCCSPAASNAQETLSSLRFGARARGILSNVQANAVVSTPQAKLATAQVGW